MHDTTTVSFEWLDLENALYDLGVEDASVYADYSGRAMYGQRCFGIVTSRPDAVGAAIALVADRSELRALIASARRDSMGYDAIVYFPGYSIEGAPEEDEDADY